MGGSSKANKQTLSDYSRMEIQDGRVLPNGLLSGIVYIPLMKDGEAISLRLTYVGNGTRHPFRKLDLCNELRLKPSAVLHLLFR
jgi:hypothetical protein